jgi:hypothetical protein
MWSRVNTVMNLRVPLKMKNVLARCGTLNSHDGTLSFMELDAIGQTNMRARLLCLSSHMAKAGVHIACGAQSCKLVCVGLRYEF